MHKFGFPVTSLIIFFFTPAKRDFMNNVNVQVPCNWFVRTAVFNFRGLRCTSGTFWKRRICALKNVSDPVILKRGLQTRPSFENNGGGVILFPCRLFSLQILHHITCTESLYSSWVYGSGDRGGCIASWQHWRPLSTPIAVAREF